jgi:hypothetical protein
MRTNPAKALKRPRLLEANDVKPFTSAEIVRIIAACDQIGRANYERLRARAMVLLMRYAESVRIPLSPPYYFRICGSTASGPVLIPYRRVISCHISRPDVRG